MPWLLLVTLLLSISPAQSSGAIDVSTLTVAAPVVVAELDLGKLNGDLTRIAWAPDGSQIYLQTADGSPASRRLHHYLVAREGGAVASANEPPPWADDY